MHGLMRNAEAKRGANTGASANGLPNSSLLKITWPKNCARVYIQRWPTAIILPISLSCPCHIFYTYKGAVLMVAPKHLLLYSIPIGSEENSGGKGPLEGGHLF